MAAAVVVGAVGIVVIVDDITKIDVLVQRRDRRPRTQMEPSKRRRGLASMQRHLLLPKSSIAKAGRLRPLARRWELQNLLHWL